MTNANDSSFEDSVRNALEAQPTGSSSIAKMIDTLDASLMPELITKTCNAIDEATKATANAMRAKANELRLSADDLDATASKLENGGRDSIIVIREIVSFERSSAAQISAATLRLNEVAKR